MKSKPVNEFLEHIRNIHNIPDICCPKVSNFFVMDKESVQALLKVLEYEFISQEHELVHELLKAMQDFVK